MLASSVIALLALAGVGAVSLLVITHQRDAFARLGVISRTQRILQDADMLDDAIHADVLALLVELPEPSRQMEGRQQQLDADIQSLRRLVAAALAMPVDEDLRGAIIKVQPELDGYVTQAVGAGHLAARDRAAAIATIGGFQDAFDRMAAANANLTNRFAARVETAETAARAAAETAVWSIVLACLLSAVAVAFVSRLLLRSVLHSLGRVRGAAAAISGGDLSVRCGVPVRDDIGSVAEALNQMADTLQGMIGRLKVDQERDAFNRQLSEVLEMADTEADTHAVVARAMGAVTSSMKLELLIADSSRAHLERATVHPTQGSPGCTVDTPYGCMAVRRGNPIVFESSAALNACSRLACRGGAPVSPVCVPLHFMGRALGVLHATGPVDQAPSGELVDQLTTLGILAGGRIGTVRAFQRTQVQASTDGLTGLANRRALQSIVRKFGTSTPYALILADLDHFKRLNDAHGHDAGDQALRAFADVLRQSLRDGDHAARWGGEEFVVVLEGRASEDAVAVADRIRAGLATATTLYGAPSVTASFGIADTTMAGELGRLLQIADDALYQSKENGRNRSTVGDPGRVNGAVPRRDAEHLASIKVEDLLQFPEPSLTR